MIVLIFSFGILVLVFVEAILLLLDRRIWHRARRVASEGIVITGKAGRYKQKSQNRPADAASHVLLCDNRLFRSRSRLCT
jgi:hypothetical protein